jgi:hypothetical protein
MVDFVWRWLSSSCWLRSRMMNNFQLGCNYTMRSYHVHKSRSVVFLLHFAYSTIINKFSWLVVSNDDSKAVRSDH